MNSGVDAKIKVAIIEDDDDVRDLILMLLGDEYDCKAYPNPLPLLDEMKTSAPDLILSDISMPKMDGLTFAAEVRRDWPDLPIVFISGNGGQETLLEAIKNQAFDYLVKPFKEIQLKDTLTNATALVKRRRSQADTYRRLIQLKEELGKTAEAYVELSINSDGKGDLLPPAGFESFATRNKALAAQIEYADAISKTSASVLILGESGSGKDVLARAIHGASGREGQLVAVNAAGLDDNLFSDTLFGHEPGAFSGAAGNRKGLIEAAEGGTLFLDEIGDLSSASQVKLLRLLENGEYYPLGSDQVKTSNARFVLATHKDIADLVAEGKFREDLFFRLDAHKIKIPPLRDRQEDIPMLFNKMFEDAAVKLGRDKMSASKPILDVACQYHWPGNVREMKALALDLLTRFPDSQPKVDYFRSRFRTNIRPLKKDAPDAKAALTECQQLPTLKEAEDFLVEEALRRTQNNQANAAQLLGISRQALNKRLTRKKPA